MATFLSKHPIGKQVLEYTMASSFSRNPSFSKYQSSLIKV
jgi:hypothetical protein